MFGFVNQVDLIKVINSLFFSFSFLFFGKETISRLGKGIYLVRDVEGLKKKFAEMDSMDKKKQVSIKPMKRIIQRFAFELH